MAGRGCLRTQLTDEGRLSEPVVGLLRDPQPLDEPGLGSRHVPGRHRDTAEVQEHPFEVVQVADLAAQPSSFRGGGVRGREVALGQRVDRPCLEQPHRGGVVLEVPA